MNNFKNNKNNIRIDTYDYSLIDPCLPDNNVICNNSDSDSSSSSSSYNSYSSSSCSSSSCTPSSCSSSSSSSSSSYNSYSSSSCSSSSCTPSSHSSSSCSSSSCTPSSHSPSCCYSCHTSSCESSSVSSHSKCDSYFSQKKCYLSGNQRTFYNNHGKCVPLPCHEEGFSMKSDNNSTINLTKYTNNSENTHKSNIHNDYKNYTLKIILKGRINDFHSFTIDHNNIHKLKKIGQYKILQIHNGYLLFYIKETNKMIDYNYYINYFNNPMEVIFIKNGLINKLIEEELDIKMYIQTLLKDDYKTYFANVFVIKKYDTTSIINNINPIDLLFYSSQAYFFLKN